MISIYMNAGDGPNAWRCECLLVSVMVEEEEEGGWLSNGVFVRESFRSTHLCTLYKLITIIRFNGFLLT